MEGLKLTNYTMTVDEKSQGAVVHTSGLHFDDYDVKNLQPKPWHLMKLLESAMHFLNNNPLDDKGTTYRDYAILGVDSIFFVVSSAFEIQWSMYDPSIPKSPLDIAIQGCFVGKSSITDVVTVKTNVGQQLLTLIQKMVIVSKATRAPIPLPEWWRKKHAKSEGNISLQVMKYSKPDSEEPFKVRVMKSEVDYNDHTNWSSYVKYAFDVLHHKVKHGELDGLLKDTNCMYLKKMELLYNGESYFDDILDVYVWRVQEIDWAVRVHIEKERKNIFQGTLNFFEDTVYRGTRL